MILWFSLQKNCNFSSVSAKFLKNLYRQQKNYFTTIYLECIWIKSRIFVTIAWSCEKWQPIKNPPGTFGPPPHPLGLKHFVNGLIYYFKKHFQPCFFILKALKGILQNFKFVNWRIRFLIFWCHEQVICDCRMLVIFL